MVNKIMPEGTTMYAVLGAESTLADAIVPLLTQCIIGKAIQKR